MHGSTGRRLYSTVPHPASGTPAPPDPCHGLPRATICRSFFPPPPTKTGVLADLPPPPPFCVSPEVHEAPKYAAFGAGHSIGPSLARKQCLYKQEYSRRRLGRRRPAGAHRFQWVSRSDLRTRHFSTQSTCPSSVWHAALWPTPHDPRPPKGAPTAHRRRRRGRGIGRGVMRIALLILDFG